MHRRLHKSGRDGKRNGETTLTRKDHVQIAMWLIIIAVSFGGFIYIYYYGVKAAHDRQVRERYHLNDDQFRTFRELEKQHDTRYQALRNEAEKTRKDVEALFERSRVMTPEIEKLFKEANRKREACWTEELEHHRRVSQIMSSDDAQFFLADKAQRYGQRKVDRNGFLILPHN